MRTQGMPPALGPGSAFPENLPPQLHLLDGSSSGLPRFAVPLCRLPVAQYPHRPGSVWSFCGVLFGSSRAEVQTYGRTLRKQLRLVTTYCEKFFPLEIHFNE